jgi:hypothetical protein
VIARPQQQVISFGNNDQLATAPSSTTATVPNTHNDSNNKHRKSSKESQLGKGVQASGNKVLAKRKPMMRPWSQGVLWTRNHAEQ